MAAVRLGLRRALRRASAPVTPRSRSSGRADDPDGGRDATGPRTTNADERPSTRAEPAEPERTVDDQDAGRASRPTASAAGPADDGPDRDAPELVDGRLAQRGERRDRGPRVRRAAAAEPTADRRCRRPAAAAIERRADHQVAVGEAGSRTRGTAPAARRRRRCRQRARRPTRRRRRTRASTTSAAATWRRVAPRARSSAISRVRWATRIEKVL